MTCVIVIRRINAKGGARNLHKGQITARNIIRIKGDFHVAHKAPGSAQEWKDTLSERPVDFLRVPCHSSKEGQDLRKGDFDNHVSDEGSCKKSRGKFGCVVSILVALPSR